jgi:outer membrane protein assembly factor BamB
MKKCSLFWHLCLCLLNLAAAGSLRAQDWPMWRYDAHRSAASPHELPEKLHLQWKRELPQVRAAWPNEHRLHFDTEYHPVVLKKMLYLGSPNDSSLTAYDTETGSELWKRYADGPVRLAPVASGGKVYFGSDDGYLYCVDATSGELQWKYRAAPDERLEKLHLGSNQLISYWPVRGGPVISEDGKTLYLASGVWPSLGIFIHSLDAETGAVNWVNQNTHLLPKTRIDHNYLEEVALSPQGHMLIANNYLVIPNGRSMPARIDLDSGELQHFVQGYRHGDSRVIANDRYALVGEDGVINLSDGREIGAKSYVVAGEDAPQSWSRKKRDQFEGPFWSYKRFPGVDFRSVLDGDVVYSVVNGKISARDLGHAATDTYTKEANGQEFHPVDWKVPELWKVSTSFNPKSRTETVIKAGSRLYTHFDQTLVAIDVSSAETNRAEMVWQEEIEEVPGEMLAADGKLFVVTEEGRLLCFGGRKGHPVSHPRENREPVSGKPGALAERILDLGKADEGYALVLGIEAGDLVHELLRHSRMKVIAVDPDQKKLDQLRRALEKEGMAENRFQAIARNPSAISLPPYLANLICSEQGDVAAALTAEQIYESLRPYGGAAVLPGRPADDHRHLFVETEGLFVARREGALDQTDQWTHETGNAARSFFSNDLLVKAPLSVLWYGDGEGYGFRKPKFYGASVKPQVAGGRLLALQQQARKLFALDIYTGRNLWVRDVEKASRYATFADAIYLAQDRRVELLDPDTGETRERWNLEPNFPDDLEVGPSEIRVEDEVIVVALRGNKDFGLDKGRWDSQVLVALDRRSGKKLWERRAEHRFSGPSIAVSGGRFFCVDSHAPMDVNAISRRGGDLSTLSGKLLCLDLNSGQEMWTHPMTQAPDAFKSLHVFELRERDDWVAGAPEHGLVIAGRGRFTQALKIDDGNVVWTNETCGRQPLLVSEVDETFINQSGQTYNLLTGVAIGKPPVFKKSGGCNYAVGSAALVFVRDRTAAYFDVESGKRYAIRNLRSGCSNSFVPADGLLNVPCFSSNCICNYPIQTSFSMYHLPVVDAWRAEQPR